MGYENCKPFFLRIYRATKKITTAVNRSRTVPMLMPAMTCTGTDWFPRVEVGMGMVLLSECDRV